MSRSYATLSRKHWRHLGEHGPSEFRLRRMEVLDFLGSDHFPLLIELGYKPERTQEHDVPQPDEATHEQVRKTRTCGQTEVSGTFIRW
jgi:hypothetical protein